MAVLPLSYNIYPIIETTRNYSLTSKKFYYDRSYFYSYKEVKESLERPCILHNLSYLQARVWQENKVHPFTTYYDDYRKLWDNHYQKNKNKNLLPNLSFVPFFNLALKTYFGEEYHQKIKKLLKKEKKT